ncbi:MAG TPA: polysaccharide deacetylase family protein [Marinobacter sp.]|nr:polysaccharide deacetylase family protein [Marinobacter sp.]
MTALLVALAGAGLLWFSWRYGWWLPARSYSQPRILMYHMISACPEGAKFRGLRVHPELFRRQIAFLAGQGWTFVTMAELMACQGNTPEKTVAITFDDGYRDNLTHALPVLRAFNAKATLYLVVDRHDRDWSVAKKAHHNSGELAREPKLTDAEVQTLLDSGLIELGSHTLTHPNLPASSLEQRWHEIQHSKTELEARFGVTVSSFAYPFGLYQPEDAELARKAGYSNAVTVEEGIEDRVQQRPFDLRRVKVSGKEGMLGFRMRLRRGFRGPLR